MEKPKRARNREWDMVDYLLVGVMIVVIVFVILALIGPTVGNIYSHTGFGMAR